MSRISPSIRAALLAGLIAILINTLLLHLADYIPLETARGGLLKLLKTSFGGALERSAIGDLWNGLGLPKPDSAVFKSGFHIVVGLLMAVVYAFLFEPYVPGSAWVKGVLYALLAWLLNAFVLLPAIDEGIAGHHHLTFAGMAYYAVAHTVFFVLLAVLYVRFRHRPARRSSVTEVCRPGASSSPRPAAARRARANAPPRVRE